jgi:hypothetical protein
MKRSGMMTVTVVMMALGTMLVFAGMGYCQQTMSAAPAGNQQAQQPAANGQSAGIGNFLGYGGGAPTGSCCQAGQCLGQAGNVCPLGGASGCCRGPQGQAGTQQTPACCVQPKQVQ